MKEAWIDVAQAAGCYWGASFAVGFFLGFIEGLADLRPEGVLYNGMTAYVLFVPSFLVSMIQISRWRQRRRSELVLTDVAPAGALRAASDD